MGVSIRTVPRNPSLKPASRKCSTNEGRSVDPASGDHSTALPSLPAIEVKVPHSWAVRLAYTGRASPRNARGRALWSGGGFGPPPPPPAGGKKENETKKSRKRVFFFCVVCRRCSRPSPSSLFSPPPAHD